MFVFLDNTLLSSLKFHMAETPNILNTPIYVGSLQEPLFIAVTAGILSGCTYSLFAHHGAQ